MTETLATLTHMQTMHSAQPQAQSTHQPY